MKDTVIRPSAVLRWLASPTGMMFVLSCLALPFVAVSCESAMGSVTADYSGADLVFGGRPQVSGTGFGAGAASGETGRIPPQPLAVLAFLGMLGALAVSLLPNSRLRSWLVCGASTGAAGALAVNQLVVKYLIARELESDPLVPSGSDLVHTRYGFVLAMLGLLAVQAFSLGDAIVRTVAPPSVPLPALPPLEPPSSHP